VDSHGTSLGATGAIFGNPLDELGAPRPKTGLATLCVGGGMGHRNGSSSEYVLGFRRINNEFSYI